eukprot:7057936-Prymnesium_polylepis.1
MRQGGRKRPQYVPCHRVPLQTSGADAERDDRLGRTDVVGVQAHCAATGCVYGPGEASVICVLGGGGRQLRAVEAVRAARKVLRATPQKVLREGVHIAWVSGEELSTVKIASFECFLRCHQIDVVPAGPQELKALSWLESVHHLRHTWPKIDLKERTGRRRGWRRRRRRRQWWR